MLFLCSIWPENSCWCRVGRSSNEKVQMTEGVFLLQGAGCVVPVTAWAFGTVGQSDVRLFAALARAAEQCMSKFGPQGLANTVWAFATVDLRCENLFVASARRQAAQRLHCAGSCQHGITIKRLPRGASRTRSWHCRQWRNAV